LIKKESEFSVAVSSICATQPIPSSRDWLLNVPVYSATTLLMKSLVTLT